MEVDDAFITNLTCVNSNKSLAEIKYSLDLVQVFCLLKEIKYVRELSSTL